MLVHWVRSLPRRNENKSWLQTVICDDCSSEAYLEGMKTLWRLFLYQTLEQSEAYLEGMKTLVPLITFYLSLGPKPTSKEWKHNSICFLLSSHKFVRSLPRRNENNASCAAFSVCLRSEAYLEGMKTWKTCTGPLRSISRPKPTSKEWKPVHSSVPSSANVVRSLPRRNENPAGLSPANPTLQVRSLPRRNENDEELEKYMLDVTSEAYLEGMKTQTERSTRTPVR